MMPSETAELSFWVVSVRRLGHGTLNVTNQMSNCSAM